MADSATAASGPSHGPAAGATLQLDVNTLGGGCLAAIPDTQGSWQLGDVLSRLPEVLPGHRYQLLKGEAVLAPGTAIVEWARPVDGRACVTAVVAAAPTQEEQRQLDLGLIDAAGALDVEQVRELLGLGADATRVQSGFLDSVMTALHAAVESCGPHRQGDGKDGERDKQEEEGRLLAVMGALLSAGADVDARRESVGLGGTFSTSALYAAVQYGSLGPVCMLLDARASIDAVAKYCNRVPGYDEQDSQSTALHAATQAGNLTLAGLLLERGADVNAVRRYKEQEEQHPLSWPHDLFGPPARYVEVRETALHMAVAGGHKTLVALLVQARADTSIARSRDGKETSLEELCVGKPGMLDALKSAKADSSAAVLVGGAFGVEVEAALAAVVRS